MPLLPASIQEHFPSCKRQPRHFRSTGSTLAMNSELDIPFGADLSLAVLSGADLGVHLNLEASFKSGNQTA